MRSNYHRRERHNGLSTRSLRSDHIGRALTPHETVERPAARSQEGRWDLALKICIIERRPCRQRNKYTITQAFGTAQTPQGEETVSRLHSEEIRGKQNIRMRQLSGFTLVEILIVVCIFGLLAAIAVPNFLKARVETQKNLCVNNLRVIEGAKEQWALLNHKTRAETTDQNEVDRLLKGGAPHCPGGGTYTYGLVGATPQCSLAGELGHILPIVHLQDDEQDETADGDEPERKGRGRGRGRGEGRGKPKGQGTEVAAARTANTLRDAQQFVRGGFRNR